MIKDIFVIFVIIFWLFALMFSFVIFVIFFDKLFKRQYSNYDTALINFDTSLGILSALIFFSYENFTKIDVNKFNNYIHFFNRICVGFSFSFSLVYLISKIINFIKSIIIKNKNEKNKIESNVITPSSDFLLSKLEYLFVFVLSILLFILFSIYNIL